jgi:hypothetical protein
VKLEERAPMLKWLLSLLVVFKIAACLAPEQPAPKGVWVVSAGAQMASVSGRVTQQIWKKAQSGLVVLE